MTVSGRPLSKAQKKELRAWLSAGGVQYPERVLVNHSETAAAWKDYQEAIGKPVVDPAPDISTSFNSPKTAIRRGRGKGLVPARVLYSLRLPADLRGALEDRARLEDRPSSEIVRLALHAYLLKPLSN